MCQAKKQIGDILHNSDKRKVSFAISEFEIKDIKDLFYFNR